MTTKIAQIENRLDRIAGLYSKINEIIDSLPIDLPKDMYDNLVKLLLGDKDLKNLIESINNRRPPRFLLVGRTGSGKSSLINAMCGKFLAKPSDVKIGTIFSKPYQYKFEGKTIFEIIDTRGIGESEKLLDNKSAEEELIDTIKDFSPDAVLFLVKAKDRDYIDKDIKVLEKVSNLVNSIPIIALATQVDELEPSHEKDPTKYSSRKMKNIHDSVEQIERLLISSNIKPLAVLPVSSYIYWDKDPQTIDENQWNDLKIEYDCRYNIDKLLDLLENNIDLTASIYFMLFTRIDQVAKKISIKLTNIFCTISSLIAATPIPFSDIYFLTTLQVILIILIAYLSGRDLDYDNAKELMYAIGGVGVGGIALRTAFQQGSKLVNLIYPGAGSGISALVAFGGTKTMGMAAIAYFIEAITEDDLLEIIKKESNFKQAN